MVGDLPFTALEAMIIRHLRVETGEVSRLLSSVSTLWEEPYVDTEPPLNGRAAVLNTGGLTSAHQQPG
jgi:hypothetical protein